MPRIHVVDRFLNETLAYRSEEEIELHRIIEYKKINDDDSSNDLEAIVKLDNGVVLRKYDNGFDVFTDEKRIVYAPVYDVETCEKEGYSMYEEEDMIGFVNRHYDYTETFSE